MGNSPASIFFRFMPKDFLLWILQQRIEEHEEAFMFDKGYGRIWTVTATMTYAICFFAAKVLVHGWQKKYPNTESAFKAASTTLKEWNKTVPSGWVMRRMSRHVFIRCDTAEEKILSENFYDAILSFGDSFSGDEKLFCYTGRSGYVRKFPNKPARIGLWHYQGCIILRSGKPYLVYTRMHAGLPEKKTVVKCHSIVKDWGELIKKNDLQTIVFFTWIIFISLIKVKYGCAGIRYSIRQVLTRLVLLWCVRLFCPSWKRVEMLLLHGTRRQTKVLVTIGM
jgi:hypothetical protein